MININNPIMNKSYPLFSVYVLTAGFCGSLSYAEETGQGIMAEPQAAYDWVVEQKDYLAENYGVTPKLNYEATVLGNPVGGISRTAGYSHLLQFGVNLDMEKIAGVQGGTIVITARHGAGRSLLPYIGNTFDISETDIRHGFFMTEMFWQQAFAEEVVVLQIGRLNSAKFAHLPQFGLQVNGGVDGNPQSLGMNGGFTGGSDTTWGGNITVTPEESYYVSGGLYQATHSLNKDRGFDFSIRHSDKLYAITEAGWTPVFGKIEANEATGDKGFDGLPGLYKVGAYYTNMSYDRFDGNGSVSDVYGFYAIGQQMVWRSRENASNNITVWGGLTWSPQKEVARMPLMGFTGATWQGLIPGRDNDKLLGAVLIGSFSSDYADAQAAANPAMGRPGNSEVVLDFSYIISLFGTAFIQPNIQYIMNPSGYSSIDDALVVGMQFGISF